jgi:TPR repeat protein
MPLADATAEIEPASVPELLPQVLPEPEISSQRAASVETPSPIFQSGALCQPDASDEGLAWAEDAQDRLRGLLTEAPLAIFAQIEEPVWWKRPTLVAVFICALCVLLWAGAREVTRKASPGKAVQTQVEAASVPVDPKSLLPVAQLVRQAQSGDPQAQFVLAQRYETGNGMPRNLPKAYSWYIVAGEAGNDSAKQAIRSLTPKLTEAQIASIRFDVGKMYTNGFGVRHRDNVAAYKWMMLAGAAGHARARAEQKKLAASMRPPEVAEAQNRASAWLSGRRSSVQLVKKTQ